MNTPEINPGIEAGAKNLYISSSPPLKFQIGDPDFLWNLLSDNIKERWRKRFLAAMNAAFATGAVGMYEKARGVPKPVDERIMIWLKVCCDQVSKIKAAENTVSKRLVLTTLYNLAESADHAVRDARKNNAAIK